MEIKLVLEEHKDRKDPSFTPSFPRHSGTLQCLGRAVFHEHQAVLLLAEADTPNAARSAEPSGAVLAQPPALPASLLA